MTTQIPPIRLTRAGKSTPFVAPGNGKDALTVSAPDLRRAIASEGGVMQTLVERGCGLDVHQATVVACLQMVRRRREIQKQMRTFGTTTRAPRR